MLAKHFDDDLAAKEQATGLTLRLRGVSWNLNDPARDIDPLPETLTPEQRQAINEAVAAHVYQVPAPLPDVAGFRAWLLARFDFSRQRILRVDQGNFYDYVRDGNWNGVRWCITDSAERNVLTPMEYADFQTAWVAYRLPSTTP